MKYLAIVLLCLACDRPLEAKFEPPEQCRSFLDDCETIVEVPAFGFRTFLFCVENNKVWRDGWGAPTDYQYQRIKIYLHDAKN